MNLEKSYPDLPHPESVLDSVRHPEKRASNFVSVDKLSPRLSRRVEAVNPGYLMSSSRLAFAEVVYKKLVEISHQLGFIPTLQGSTAISLSQPDGGPLSNRDWDIQLIPNTDSAFEPPCLSDIKNRLGFEEYKIEDRPNRQSPRATSYFRVPYQVKYTRYGQADENTPHKPLILTVNHEIPNSRQPELNLKVNSMSLKLINSTGSYASTVAPIVEFGFPLTDRSGQIIPIPSVDPSQSMWAILTTEGAHLINRDSLEVQPPEWLADQTLLKLIMFFRNLRKEDSQVFPIKGFPPLDTHLKSSQFYAWENHLVRGAIMPLDGLKGRGSDDIFLSLLANPKYREDFLTVAIPGFIYTINQLPDPDNPQQNWDAFLTFASGRLTSMRSQLAYVDYIATHLNPNIDRDDDPQIVHDELITCAERSLFNPDFHLRASKNPQAAISWLRHTIHWNY